jgi:hypothetical protein
MTRVLFRGRVGGWWRKSGRVGKEVLLGWWSRMLNWAVKKSGRW